jgi:hypothetical protein
MLDFVTDIFIITNIMDYPDISLQVLVLPMYKVMSRKKVLGTDMMGVAS